MSTPKRRPTVGEEAAASIGPTLRQMLALWLPLAVSGEMMVIEPSIINIALGRTTQAELALAAYGVAFSLALLVEAPILMLIDASVARASDRAALALLERFSLAAGLVVTAIGLLISVTPLYGLIVERLMNIPPDVAAQARPTLVILSFWPMPIGWRRTQQGLLIRARQTMVISLATVVRLVVLAAGLAGGLVLWSHSLWSVAVIAGVAMDLSVIVEAALVTWAARRALASGMLPEQGSKLVWSELWRFYWPLATTSVIQQVSRPVLNAGIATAVLGRESLAAWPVVWGLVLLIAGPAWSLQQLSNALAADGQAYRRVRTFAVSLSLIFTGLLAVVGLTPLYSVTMSGVYNLAPELQGLAHPALLLMIPYPLLLGMQGLLRGVLIRRGCTPPVRAAVAVNVAMLAVTLVVGTRLLAPTGVVLAAVAVEAALAAELGWLRWRGHC